MELKSKGLLTNIKQCEIESKSSEKKIDELESDSKEKNNQIIDFHSRSIEVLGRIEEMYGFTADTVRSGEFKDRRDNLKKEVIKWEKYVLWTSLVFLVLVVGVFLLQLGLNDWSLKNLKVDFYLRFLLLSPLGYYLYFCSNQHSKVQKLYDKYNFKTTLTMSIQHHIDMLMKQEKFIQEDQLDKVVDFILDGFKKVYSEPYFEEDQRLKIKLANIELELEKKIFEMLKDKRD